MTPTRKRRKLTPDSASGPSTEDCVSCTVCSLPHPTKECPIIKGNIRIDDTRLPPKAILTLPDSLICREVSNGVFEILAKEPICKGTQFGPLDAPKTSIFNSKWKYVLQVFKKKSNTSMFLDTSDPNKCNWMTLVRFASSDSAQRNCICYQLDSDIYFTVVEDIQGGDPLVVSYSPGYEGMLNEATNEPIRKLRKSASLSIATSEDSPEDTQRQDHEHDYSSTPVRRSKKIKIVRHASGDTAVDSIDAGTETTNLDSRIEENSMEADMGDGNIPESDIKHESVNDMDTEYDDEGYVINLSDHFKEEDYGVDIKSEDEDFNPSVTDPVSRENKRKEMLKRLGAVLAQKEWECKFCRNIFEKIEDFSVHLINHYKTVGAARTEKARQLKEACFVEEAPASPNRDQAEAEEAGSNPDSVKTSTRTDEVSGAITDTETTEASTIPNENLVGTAEDEIVSGEIALAEDNTTNGHESVEPTRYQSSSCIQHAPVKPGTRTIESDPDHSPEDQDLDNSIEVKTESKESEDTDLVKVKEEPIDAEVESEDCPLEATDGDTEWATSEVNTSAKPPEEVKYPYTCDICVSKRIFNRAEYLIRHLKKHSGEFFCYDCGRLHKSAEGFTSHKCEHNAAGKRPPKISTCTICKKVFRSLRHLNHHLQMQHGKTYNCTTCSRVFPSGDLVASHSCRGKPAAPEPEVLDAIELYACSICNETFPLVTQLEKHLRVHGCTIACAVCDKGLSHNRLKAHMSICETLQAFSTGATRQLRCPTCKEVCGDIQYFREHMTKHTHPFMCPSCTLRLTSESDIKTHECTSFQCDGCEENFEKFIDLKKHVDLVHPDVEYFCYECAIPFVTQDGINNHKTCEFDPTVSVDTSKPLKKRSKYSNNGDFICEECGATYKKFSSFKTHRQTHRPKRYACETCGKTFHRREMLEEHIFVHQTAQFECPDCGKKMKSKKSLQIHSQIHKGIKRFECGICHRAFTQKVNLMSHELTHIPTSEKNFQCQYCSKRFSSKEYLGFHIEAHETGRSQVCDLCNQSFVKPHMLMQHKRAAHGTQRYQCEFCNLVVKQKHSLRRHLEKRHDENRADWDIPGYLEGRYHPGAGGFERPTKPQTFPNHNYNYDSGEEEERILEDGEVVEEEQCVEDSIIDSNMVADEMQASDSNLTEYNVILTDGSDTMVEIETINHLDGQQLLQDSDGNLILLHTTETGELVLIPAHAQMGQILQVQEGDDII